MTRVLENEGRDTVETVTAAIRSDHLRPIRDFMERAPQLHALGIPVQLRVVLDANAVFQDLIWLTKSRRNPAARTRLQELIDNGTVLAFAPNFLDDEVREHAERLAPGSEVGLDTYLSAWEAYKNRIIFVPTQEEDEDAVDPDDVAYIEAYHAVGAHAIYSNDIDVREMGAKTIDKEVVLSLFLYSRSASHCYSISFAGTIATVVTWQMLLAVVRGLIGLIAFLRAMPPWLKAMAIGSCLIALSRPEVRAWVLERGRAAVDSSAPVVKAGLEIASELGVEALRKAEETRNAVANINRDVGRRVPLRVYLRVVCLVDSKPRTVDELSTMVIAKGYETNNKTFAQYVRRVLHSVDGFVEVEGKWTVEA